MRFFDLHCDTLTVCLEQGKSLRQNDLQLDLLRGSGLLESWVQTFAIFVPDELRGEAAWQYYRRAREFFSRQLRDSGGLLSFGEEPAAPHTCQALLSIEGGAVLGGDLSRIETLARDGVSLFGITWNGANELSGGIGTGGGLTSLGKTAIPLLEGAGILLDVSHLSVEGVEEVLTLATGPVLATHSNARALCPHRRNLSDVQIRQIAASQGLIGVNFYPPFVEEEAYDYPLSALIRQIEYLAALAGPERVALGSDFDGASMPSAIKTIKGLANLYASMVKYFGELFTNQVFYENAAGFFQRHRQRGRKKDVL